ncbi:MAG: hypothetical protein WAM67_12225, partial [Candidatus Acidiferrales bacterium]
IYLGSADWMQRNIYERVEVIFHLRDAALHHQILTEVVAPYLADTQKTRLLLPSGEYIRWHESPKLAHSKNGFRFNVQEFFIDFAEGREGLQSVPAAPSFLRSPTPESTPEPSE